jgi:hypothetical protein
LTPTAGDAFGVTITALDGADAVDDSYAGTKCVTFYGPGDAADGTVPTYPPKGACAAGSSVVFANGLATVSVTLVDPETTTLEVTDNSSSASGASAPITVTGSVVLSTTTAPVGTTTTGPTTTTTAPAGTTTTGPTTTTTAPAGTTTTGPTTTTTAPAGTTTSAN